MLSILAVFFVLPFTVFLVAICKWSKVRDKKSTIHYSIGSLYEELSVKNGKRVLLQQVAFLSRRLHLAVLAIFFTEQTFVFQIMQIIGFTMGVTILPYLIDSISGRTR